MKIISHDSMVSPRRARIVQAVLVVVVAVAVILRIANRESGGQPGLASFVVMGLAALCVILLSPAASRRLRSLSKKE